MNRTNFNFKSKFKNKTDIFNQPEYRFCLWAAKKDLTEPKIDFQKTISKKS